jgi:membrane fusion protein, macrolide-specific efflux system
MNDSASSFFSRPSPLRKVVIGALVVLGGAVVWYGVHKYRARNADTGDYIFASVQRGNIEDLVTATGTLQPRDYVDVGAQVSGQVENILIEVGDSVKQGQLLMEIDATQSQARVEANRANLRAQESQLIDRQNNLTKAERDYQRQLNLQKDEATTLEAVQNAETALITAKQAIVTLKEQMAQQQATMRVEETNLKFTRILAPITGTVVSIAAKRGQTINATQQAPTLLRIADLNTMTVQTQVSEADVSKLHNGMSAYFTTLGSQNRRWYGTLKRIEPTPTVTNNVVLYNALFDVQNENNALMPSMTAQVFFVRADVKDVLVMPMAALQQGQQLARAAAEKAGKKLEMPGAGGAPGGNAAGPNAGGARPEGATGAAAGAPAAQGAAPAGAAANAAGGGNGQRGQGGGGQGFGGQRPGGFNGGQPPTPEQIEQFRKMREQRQAQGGGASGQRQPQQRRGIVMVKKADGTLEQRDVVIGTTNRVHGEVLSGVTEGEEVVAGMRQQEAAAAGSTPAQGQGQNQNRPGQFPGGGFPGGGFRP